MTTKLNIEHLNFSYEDFSLKDINLKLEEGKFYAILGQNGCGKTTLLNCIDKLEIPDRAKFMAYVPQQNIQNELNVYDTIMLGRRPYISFSPTIKDHEIVVKTIEQFNLSNITLKTTNELSRGMFQKVCIARSFAQETPVLLLDEPTNNLDVSNQHEILKIVKESSKTILCVLHDINLAIKYADKLIFMKDGTIVTQGDKSIVTKKLLKDIYGVESHIFEENDETFIVV